MDANEDVFEALVRLLEGDLETLFDLTFTLRKPVPEANIRTAATILRRWLVDGDLKRLEAQVTVPITFTTQDTAGVVSSVNEHRDVDFFLAAGVRMDGRPISNIYHSPLESKEVKTRLHLPMPYVDLSLKKFVSQRRHYFRGQWFTLEQQIRYVANKLGGNHYDSSREGFYAGLDESSRFMRYGGPRDALPGSELYLILEPSSTEILAGVHLEIIAAASSLIQMKIGGEPLLRLETKRPSFTNPRRWFRRSTQVEMIDFAESPRKAD